MTMTKEQVNTTDIKQEDEVRVYDNAHLVVYCGKCGGKYILEENIAKDKGIQIFLPPTSKSEMRLVCKDCKNSMGLFYVEATKKNDSEDATETIQETTSTNESVQEDSITEATIV
jgi:transposase-like protein